MHWGGPEYPNPASVCQHGLFASGSVQSLITLHAILQIRTTSTSQICKSPRKIFIAPPERDLRDSADGTREANFSRAALAEEARGFRGFEPFLRKPFPRRRGNTHRRVQILLKEISQLERRVLIGSTEGTHPGQGSSFVRASGNHPYHHAFPVSPARTSRHAI